MTPQPEPDDLMLLYVSGAADADEIERAEALLSAARPAAAAAYAEALAVFHAVPLGLTPVQPPAHCRQSLLGRVTADLSQASPPALPAFSTAAAFSPTSNASPPPMSIGLASRLQWPLYVTSGLAACLAVALTLTLATSRQLSARLAAMSERDERMSSTLETARQVMSSPRVTLASLTTREPAAVSNAVATTAKPYGRVLFCPINRQYQFAVFNLRPLPAGRAYELWLIPQDGVPVPAGVFTVNADGSAMVVAQPARRVENVMQVAVSDEPAGGSPSPTGGIHLAGPLPVQ